MIVSFFILLCLVIAGVQNSTSLQISFLWWTFQMSIPALLLWAGAAGAAVVAVLSLPKLSLKTLQTRRLGKEVRRLEELCKKPRQESAA
jgi:uncharacterized integral membrane protein